MRQFPARTHIYIYVWVVFSSFLSSWTKVGQGELDCGGRRYRRALARPAVSFQGRVSGSLFVTVQLKSPSATWQESRCDLLWTNDGAKHALICHSQWIKSCQVRRSLPNNPATCYLSFVFSVVCVDILTVVCYIFFTETLLILGY